MGSAANQTVLRVIWEAREPTTRFRDLLATALPAIRGKEPDVGSLAGNFAAFAGERHQAASMLIQWGMLWDAEIVMRSAFEAVAKFLFLCLPDEGERAARVEEFLVLLAQENDLRQSRHAAAACDDRGSDDMHHVVFRGLTIPGAQAASIRAKWPRRRRKEVSQKWSFTEMIAWIDKRLDSGGGDTPAFRGLLHNYAIASNFLHADERAFRFLADRSMREEAERTRLEDAHAARLVSDIVSNYGIMVKGVTNILGSTPEGWAEARAAFDRFSASTDGVQQAFMDTQVDYYAGLGLKEEE